MKRGCTVQFIPGNSILFNQIEFFLDKWYIEHSLISLKKNEEQLKQEIQKHDFQAMCSGVNFLDKKRDVLQEIRKIQMHYSLPVLTPLISMSEKELKKSAKKVGILL